MWRLWRRSKALGSCTLKRPKIAGNRSQAERDGTACLVKDAGTCRQQCPGGILNSLCTDTFDKIVSEAGRLCKINKKKTLSSREVRGGGAAGFALPSCAARAPGVGRLSRLGRSRQQSAWSCRASWRSTRCRKAPRPSRSTATREERLSQHALCHSICLSTPRCSTDGEG